MVAGGRELIDTLWNVNKITKAVNTLYEQELIDTLWNVNLNPSMHLHLIIRINRYIMECK